jgi:outer membrane protein assembly factor BamB
VFAAMATTTLLAQAPSGRRASSAGRPPETEQPKEHVDGPNAAPRLFPAQPLWNLPLNNILTTLPALAGTRGYFPIAQDRLVAYELQEGTLLWTAPVHAMSQPAIGDGLVFVVEAATLTALSEETGEVRWRLPFTESLAVPLVWDNGWLIAATTGGTILAFRGNDGTLIWQQEVVGGVHAKPALAADRVYIATDNGRVVALRVDTGLRLWDRAIGGVPNEMLALDDRVYAGSTDKYFYCLNTTTGAIEWRWSTGGNVVGLPIADEHRVYFISLDNVLRALDRHSGAQRWKRALPLRPTRGVIRVGDTIIVSGISATAPAYWLKDGTPAGEITGGGELAAAPFAVSGTPLPRVVLITRDLAKGTIIHAIGRSLEPPTASIAPLPNPIVPTKPRTTPLPSDSPH